MYVPDRTHPDNPGAFRSVPSQNLVRILSGELPVPGMKRPTARARQIVRLTFWQRLLRALGLFG